MAAAVSIGLSLHRLLVDRYLLAESRQRVKLTQKSHDRMAASIDSLYGRGNASCPGFHLKSFLTQQIRHLLLGLIFLESGLRVIPYILAQAVDFLPFSLNFLNCNLTCHMLKRSFL